MKVILKRHEVDRFMVELLTDQDGKIYVWAMMNEDIILGLDDADSIFHDLKENGFSEVEIKTTNR